ncbi:excretory canal abnormal protein 6-like [Gadus chalcogrammus]|uniref:excretory canal abnormal protein 6-like n=1 Tax=Gadus chalcogrammus TaxID=1042646 RepID=UPI0024C48EE1|nr:excretory canal abnormal protein 6-like [Gadus chalcogrammus]
MEELFSHDSPGLGSMKTKTLHRMSVKPTSAGRGEAVTILNQKRSMNVGIFLKQFRRPVRDMIADISSGTSTGFGTGKLRELCKMLPEEGEVRDLKKFKGKEAALAEADLFMLMLVKTPSYEERLNCLVLQEEFFPIMEDMKQSITLLTAAAKELLECENLHSVILLVRKTGNHLNAGSYAGSAIGFRMSSLLKLVDTKANKPGMNLMHYVVMEADKYDSNLLQFPQQLKLIGAASRINKDDISAEFQKEVKRVQVAKVEAEKQENLKALMDDFLKGAASLVTETQQSLEALNAASDSVAQFFGEDPSKFKLQECCTIFSTFCEKFMRAIQENKDRIASEIKKKNRLHIAAKRRSTATCAWEKESKGMELESFLHTFASSRSSRRRIGKFGKGSPNNGSPNNGSPNNGSLSEICAVAMADHTGPSRSLVVLSEEKGPIRQDSAAPNLTDSSRLDEPPPPSRVKDISSKTPEVKPPNAKSDCDVAAIAAMKPDSGTSTGGRVVGIHNREEQEQEAEPVGNTPEEAQKLREASRKVLRYQSSRGSVTSGDQVLGNVKSPGPTSQPTQRRTLDLDDLRGFPEAKEGKEPAKRPLSDIPLSNAIGRRHTLCLPSGTAKQAEEEDEVWMPLKERTRPLLGDLGKMKSLESGLYASLITPRLFDGLEDGSPPPMEEKRSKTNFPFPPVLPVEDSSKQSQAGTSSQALAGNLPKKPQISPDKSTNVWHKSDILGFFKRLGNRTKLPNTNEPAYSDGTGSSV